jgi:hypothetical protein
MRQVQAPSLILGQLYNVLLQKLVHFPEIWKLLSVHDCFKFELSMKI